MSYGLNVEMQKQTEIAKRLSAICAQLVPYLSQEVNNLTFNYLYAILKFLRFIFSSNLIHKFVMYTNFNNFNSQK